jgi:4-hydroxy-3-polyprenylbenzoate decarboxylase
MAFTDLREFVARLEHAGRLHRVVVPVSRDLEITEIVDRVSKSPGRSNVALLFERVEGTDVPVLVNAFGSEDRMALALGVERLDELGERVAKLLEARLPGTFAERLRKLGTLIDVVRAAPRRVQTAPCQEIVETAAPSLAGLPILTCWPGDGGRYITLPGVFSRDPLTGARNVGMYRLQVFDDQTLGMHWQTHKGGAEHQRRATTRMPVAIVLGGDPAMIYAASAPLPPGIDEVVFAGWLRGAGVEMVRCRTNDLEVPARPRSCWRAGWIPPSSVWRGRSAITPATTRSPASTPCSTSPPSPGARGRSIRRRSSAARPRRTTCWARRPSASSCRSCG